MQLSIPGISLALPVTFFVTYVSSKALNSLFASLTSPPYTFVKGAKQSYWGHKHTLFHLWGVFLIMGCLFAATGGSLLGLFTLASNPLPNESTIQLCFIGGLLIAGLTRIRSATSSMALANAINTLALVSLSSLVFWVAYSTISGRSDSFNAVTDILKQNVTAMPLQVVMYTLIAVIVVEVILFAQDTFCCDVWRQIPKSVLRDRVESFEKVEQIFWPSRVIEQTNHIIRNEIEKNGLKSVCWTTNTAPPSHIMEILNATKAWVESKWPTTSNPQDCAQRIFAATVRIIVPRREVKVAIQQQFNYCKRFRVTNEPIRTRVMILNSRIAITHIPVPYTNEPGEESNYAAISMHPESVHEMETLFDNMWEHIYGVYEDVLVAKLVMDNKPFTGTILMIICENLMGVDLKQIMKDPRISSSKIKQKQVEESVNFLMEMQLVSWDNGTKKYRLRRRRTVGGTLDKVVRLVNRDFVDAHWS